MEGIDFDEIFAPVARLESIRILLAIASLQAISNGCQECFLEWNVARRGILLGSKTLGTNVLEL